jgi:uncharacterized membrane protein
MPDTPNQISRAINFKPEVQGWKRRIIYLVSFEALAMSIAAVVLSTFSGAEMIHTGVMSIMITATGLTINLLYNRAFEAWEARQTARFRSIKRRIVHALGFQLVLVMFLIPLIAWWLNVSLLQAILLDAVLIAFFPVYTFMFNWAFDSIFGLPDAVTRSRMK